VVRQHPQLGLEVIEAFVRISLREIGDKVERVRFKRFLEVVKAD